MGLGLAEPAAPDWFVQALANEPRRSSVRVREVDLECLEWGRVGAPGLIFVHGNGAGAEWWRFIAPFFSETHHVVALSLSGNGRSSYREEYGSDVFVAEVMGVAQKTGLLNGPVAPVMVGHSLGGAVVVCAAAAHGENFAGAMAIDALIHPGKFWGLALSIPKWRPSKTREALFERFRFTPAQPCTNLYIAHFIARVGMKQMNSSSGAGWVWRHDPKLLDVLDFNDAWDALHTPCCPLLLMRAELSGLTADPHFSAMMAQVPPETQAIVIPEAHHHVMVDQPLKLVEAIQHQLDNWA